jgi:hypothetical protein
MHGVPLRNDASHKVNFRHVMPFVAFVLVPPRVSYQCVSVSRLVSSAVRMHVAKP